MNNSRQSVTLVIDIANLDGVLSSILGRKPGRFDRPDFRSLLDWARRSFGGPVRGFAVLKEPQNPRCQPFLGTLRAQGYSVVLAERFAAANGVCSPSSLEVDDHVCAHLLESSKSDVIAMVGHDMFAGESLSEQVARGARCLAIGFPELMSHTFIEAGVELVDIEDLGVYARSLPRFTLSIN